MEHPIIQIVNLADFMIRIIACRHFGLIHHRYNQWFGCSVGKGLPITIVKFIHVLMIVLLFYVDHDLVYLAWPNLLERLLFSNITDYISLYFLTINLNDMVIAFYLLVRISNLGQGLVL